MPAAALTVLASATVRSGDTVYAISRRFGVTPQAVIDTNHLQPPYLLRPGQVLRLPQPRGHTVRAGDSLYALSRRYGVSTDDLARANGLGPPYTIFIGQRLRLPTPPVTVASTTPQRVAPPAVAPVSTAPLAPIEVAPRPVVTSTAPPEPTAAPTPIAPIAPGTGAAPATTVAALAPFMPPLPARRPARVVAAAVDQTALPVLAAPPPRAGSAFRWPISGDIVSPFGPKDDGRRNDGVNIAAARGTPIVAAENGVVSYAGNEVRGYGNLVLIRHDEEWVTAYGHADRVLVRRGERVDVGQTIATVGSSGTVATPQLHFEIRRGSKAVDPLDHLPPMSAR